MTEIVNYRVWELKAIASPEVQGWLVDNPPPPGWPHSPEMYAFRYMTDAEKILEDKGETS